MEVTNNIVLVLVSLFGLFIGSYLNVCIYRIPRNQSIGQTVVFGPFLSLEAGLRLFWDSSIKTWHLQHIM